MFVVADGSLAVAAPGHDGDRAYLTEQTAQTAGIVAPFDKLRTTAPGPLDRLHRARALCAKGSVLDLMHVPLIAEVAVNMTASINAASK